MLSPYVSHHEQRELSVYAIRLGSGGPKMAVSTSGLNDPSGFGLRGFRDLVVRNMTMATFATWMQSGVMDKPVVDLTELKDRYDFNLKWTPDESQFAQFRGTMVLLLRRRRQRECTAGSVHSGAGATGAQDGRDQST
jgi:uncharacterized protein (TIGR03435 family)